MDRVFEPDREAIRNNRTIYLLWAATAALFLLVIWIGTFGKLRHDLNTTRQDAAKHASVRARIYAEQVLRTVKEIDQISLTVSYQWRYMAEKLDLADQYDKAMHHTPTYPAAIGVDGRIWSSWRKASVGLDMSHIDFFEHHRNHPDTSLRINPPSLDNGDMAGQRTIRFTRRVNDANGDFAGVVMVSTEPSFLVSLSSEDELNTGDFISVRLNSGPLLAAKIVDNRERQVAYYRGIPHFGSLQDVREEPSERFVDDLARTIAWKKIDGYPLVAVAGITEASAVVAYAPTRSAWLSFAIITSVLVIAMAIFGSVASIRSSERRSKAERVRSTFRMAVDGAREAFLMIEPIRATDGAVVDYRVEDCNDRAAALYRLHRDQLIGRSFAQLYKGDQYTQRIAIFNNAFENRFFEGEYVVGSNELHQPGWFHRRAVRSGNGIAITVRDITDSKLQEQALAALAVTDTLTGLPNRRWLNNYLPGALQRARAARKRVALLFIDLDNLKKINDSEGHAAGDELLRTAALCLKSAVRGSDYVARLGGDEFTVLIENVEREVDAELVAGQIVKAFDSSDIFSHWAALNSSCSIGVALYPTHAQDADGLLQCADAAMYEAKIAGKDRYSVYVPRVDVAG